MKQFINKILMGTLVLGMASCTGDYLDINSNPYQPDADDMEADDYALVSAMNNIAATVISSDVNTLQFTECLLGGPCGGYFASTNTGWNNTIENFNATDDWTRVFLKTDRIIPQLYGNLTQVQNLATQMDNPVPYAVALIMKVAAMSRVTDAYGPIPYSKIGEDGSITTPYDAQADVYNKFFEELDEAIATLDANPGAALSASADYVYGGDIAKWRKLANSLKLRLAMRIVYADEALARTKVEEAVNDEGGLIESNGDNAVWDYFGSITNPFYTATRYNSYSGSDHVCQTGGDTHVAADIICYMNGYGDPRRAAYFIPSEWDGYDYVGVRRGVILSTLGTSAHRYSGVRVTQTDPIQWMNAAEVAFLRAEAAAIFGFSVGGSAQSFYEQGVQLSFEQWGVAAEASAYLADDTSLPEIYDDPMGQYGYGSRLSTVTVKWDESASTAEKQERILIQKWIANWMLGNEAWADYRRTGYPHLLPTTEEGNLSGGIVDNTLGARRMPYPSNEYVSNAANVTEAVSTLLGGPDNYATRIWWDCNPSVN